VNTEAPWETTPLGLIYAYYRVDEGVLDEVKPSQQKYAILVKQGSSSQRRRFGHIRTIE
jgi:hypothetical protein